LYIIHALSSYTIAEKIRRRKRVWNRRILFFVVTDIDVGVCVADIHAGVCVTDIDAGVCVCVVDIHADVVINVAAQ